MKDLIRSILAYMVAIWATSNYLGGVGYGGDVKILFLAALALSIGHVLIIPLINLLLLPINILTLGSFRWVSTVALLVVVSLIIPGFSIHSFTFSGLATPYFSLPSFPVGTFFAYIFVSFVMSLITNLFFWLVD